MTDEKTPALELQQVLLPLYGPCPAFADVCGEAGACWDPARGHVPRGFVGACGRLSDVEVVLLLAEPGDPYPGDTFPLNGKPEQLLAQALDHTHGHVAQRRETFHRNLRLLLDLLFPNTVLNEQLRKV